MSTSTHESSARGERRIHQSLLRQPYFLSVPREVLLVEIFLAILYLALFGPQPKPVLVGLVLALPLHGALVRVSRDDPETILLLKDALSYRSFYPAQGRLTPFLATPPRSSLPRI